VSFAATINQEGKVQDAKVINGHPLLITASAERSSSMGIRAHDRQWKSGERKHAN
jgi:hypothetical protein